MWTTAQRQSGYPSLAVPFPARLSIHTQFLERSISPNVEIYGFCAANYLRSAPESLHTVRETNLLHLIFATPQERSPVQQDNNKTSEEVNEQQEKETPTMRNHDAGPAMKGGKFLGSYYEHGCEKKYKNSADYVLAMYAVRIPTNIVIQS